MAAELAFVSTRTDHGFIAIYRNDTTPLRFIAPTTSQDFNPRWSPNGERIAFMRVGGDGGPPQNPLNWNPTPWQIWVADVAIGERASRLGERNERARLVAAKRFRSVFGVGPGDALVFQQRAKITGRISIAVSASGPTSRRRAARAGSVYGRGCLGRAGS